MTTQRAGLREHKKRATREALRAAALRLALERGPENVRVDDIADAAGVSPRTYNNYFSSREQAIVAAVTAEREMAVASAVAARPDSIPLATAVIEAVVQQYTDPGERSRDALLLLTTRPALRDAYLATTTAIEDPLAAAIADRIGDGSGSTASVLAASVAAAIRIALQRWLQPAGTSGLVVSAGALPELLEKSLTPLVPALDAAERASRG